MKKLLLAAALAATSAAAPANAAVIYEQAIGGTWTGSPCTPCGTSFRVFATFDTAASYVLTDLSFHIHDPQANAGGIPSINISIWDPTSNTQIFGQDYAGAAITKTPFSGTDHFRAEVSLPNWVLPAGNYYLSVYGLPGHTLGWLEGTAPKNDIQVNGSTPTSGVQSNRGVAFTLSGNATAVPEPAALSLIGLGVAGIAAGRRRKKA